MRCLSNDGANQHRLMESAVPNDKIALGPVLSFRGMSVNVASAAWRVSALLGVQTELPPSLTVDNRECEAPRLLLVHDGVRYFRYDATVMLGVKERTVAYGISEREPSWHFTVPSVEAEPRFAYVSCNGFSDPARMRKLTRPAGAVWDDLLCNHDVAFRATSHPGGYSLDKEQLWHEAKIHSKGLQRFHLLLMGGDQIYFDSIWEDIAELKTWTKLSRKKQIAFRVSPTLRNKIDSYYLSLYRERWMGKKRQRFSTPHPLDAADAMANIPTIMMWDDHDIFDGWGSYSTDLQASELFQVMFRSARRAFWVFQLQHASDDLPDLVIDPDFSNAKDPKFKTFCWSSVLQDDPLALPLLDDQAGFSSAFSIGPVALLAPDLRTERSQHQIMSEPTWRAWQRWAWSLPNTEAPNASMHKCQYLLVMSSVPVAHPKLSLAETFLDTFTQDDVLKGGADDLRDHWTHDDHEGERKRLIQSLASISESKKMRIVILSGDVHVAAWGTIFKRRQKEDTSCSEIHQFTSSAVVHPSLAGLFESAFLGVLNLAASMAQVIDVDHEIKMMIFPGYGNYIKPARNWLAVELSPDQGDMRSSKLWATWRCESKDSFSNHLYALDAAT